MGRRDRILLLLLFFCGLRRGEIIHVSVEDFYENQGHTLLRIHGKGRSDKSDAVLVPPDIWPEIREYIDGREGPLFISRYRNQERQLSPSRVYLLFKKYCRQAGIDPTAFSPHSTRATYITLCLKGGAGLLQVAYAARHSDPATTIRYDRARMNLEKHASTFLKIQTSPSPSITDGDSTSNQ